MKTLMLAALTTLVLITNIGDAKANSFCGKLIRVAGYGAVSSLSFYSDQATDNSETPWNDRFINVMYNEDLGSDQVIDVLEQVIGLNLLEILGADRYRRGSGSAAAGIFVCFNDFEISPRNYQGQPRARIMNPQHLSVWVKGTKVFSGNIEEAGHTAVLLKRKKQLEHRVNYYTQEIVRVSLQLEGEVPEYNRPGLENYIYTCEENVLKYQLELDIVNAELGV